MKRLKEYLKRFLRKLENSRQKIEERGWISKKIFNKLWRKSEQIMVQPYEYLKRFLGKLENIRWVLKKIWRISENIFNTF